MGLPTPKYEPPELCPKCGAQPEIRLTMYGYANFARCGTCGWEGATRDLESSPNGVLWHWNNKVIEHNKQSNL